MLPLTASPHRVSGSLQSNTTNNKPLDTRLAWLSVATEDRHTFLNISVTPLECSVVCHAYWATSVFEPAISRLPPEQAKLVSVSCDRYVVLCVESVGTDVGSRVVELTSPLAMAGIPIFFITTYYSDFILAPARDLRAITAALRARGFELEVAPDSATATMTTMHSRSSSSLTGIAAAAAATASESRPPSTPPPSTLSELQSRTFALLRRHGVVPFIEPGLTLVQCSGHARPRRTGGEHGGHIHHQHHHHSRPSMSRSTTCMSGLGGMSSLDGSGTGTGSTSSEFLDGLDARLYVGLVSALAHSHSPTPATPTTTAAADRTAQQPPSPPPPPSPPRFLSLTLAADDPPSLLLDRTLLPFFGPSIAGDTGESLVPLFLDLAPLPFEATGIVSGVAGKLAELLRGWPPTTTTSTTAAGEGTTSSELSYLSTARAGAVILGADETARALEGLKPLLVRKDDEAESKEGSGSGAA